jgi:hypothetical protein
MRQEVSMNRFLQIGLAAVALGGFGTALADSPADTGDTRTDVQKQAGDTTDQIPSDVPKNPMNTPDSQRNLDTNPLNQPSDTDKLNQPSDTSKLNQPSDTDKLNQPSDTDKLNQPSDTNKLNQPGDTMNQPSDTNKPSTDEHTTIDTTTHKKVEKNKKNQ